MKSEHDSSLVTEFQHTYESAEKPNLPKELSNYRFVSCLSDSGQKKTWLLEKSNGQKILCKYAVGEYIEMLRTESSFGSLGKFPFVPYVFDYFETEDAAYLLREYIEGQTLSEIVEKEGTLSPDRAIPLIEQLCGHLSRLHASVPPIIYRDLKPSNIVLHSSGDCYLIDMGTIRTYHEDHSLDTVFIGTVDIAAPEQFGARQTDNRTDIYALGILIYYLLTGEVKLQKDKLKKLPARIAAVIRKCTAFDPDDRYSQISKVATALHPSARSKTWIAAVLAACCTAVVLLVFSRIYESKDAVDETDAAKGFVSEDSVTGMTEEPESEMPEEVVFTSSLLEEAVRKSVNKTDGEPVYEEDLSRITSINICGKTAFYPEDMHEAYIYNHTVQGAEHGYGDITDISLLAKMPNLHHVVLDFQQINDLSPLENLQLITLSVCGNPVWDISPLGGQTALTDLYIAETEVVSLEALRECRSLSVLDCSGTQISFLEPVALLPIHELYMLNMPARDFEALSATPLQKLYCNQVEEDCFDAIKDIASLQGLTIYHSDITSLKELTGLSQLNSLDVTGNNISNLDGIEQFTNLNSFIIYANPVADLSPLATMDNISILNIAVSVDVDFTFLNEMPRLEYVLISSSQRDALYEAVPEPWFELEFTE